MGADQLDGGARVVRWRTGEHAAKLERGPLAGLQRALLDSAVLPHQLRVEHRVRHQRRRVRAQHLPIEAPLKRYGAPALVVRGREAPPLVQPHEQLVVNVSIVLPLPLPPHRGHLPATLRISAWLGVPVHLALPPAGQLLSSTC